MSLLLLFVGASTGGPPPAAVTGDDRIRLGQKETISVTVNPTIGGGAIHG